MLTLMSIFGGQVIFRDRTEVAEKYIAESTTEEERARHRPYVKKSWPRIGLYKLDWDKRDLVHLYEDINFVGNPEEVFEGLDYSPSFLKFKRLPREVKATCASYLEHTTHNGLEILSENKVQTKVKLYWLTEVEELTRSTSRLDYKKGLAFSHNSHINLKKYFTTFDWKFPLLLGSQHRNRVKRDTKVYILSGPHKGRHGTVVGHGSNFDLKRWGSEIDVDPYHFSDNRSPLLKVYFICPVRGVGEILDIRQDIVKLVDLQNQLKFGLPVLGPVNAKVKYNYLQTIERRKSLCSSSDKA